MKIEIPCPHCGHRLMDADKGVQTMTKVVNPYDHGLPANSWMPDFYIKCLRCKKKIGLKKLNIN
jgi:DNA-directed RNA polymerase subunit RPC12/RpoP